MVLCIHFGFAANVPVHEEFVMQGIKMVRIDEIILPQGGFSDVVCIPTLTNNEILIVRDILINHDHDDDFVMFLFAVNPMSSHCPVLAIQINGHISY